MPPRRTRLTPPRRSAALTVGALAALAVPVTAAAQSTEETAVIAVVDAFHTALASGDSTTALAQLTPDVTILESGNVETLEQYRSGHLRGGHAVRSGGAS
jgi:hypothetical protein